MADLTTTIHETIEQHRYAVPAGEMSYRPGDPICSCGWRPPKPNGELHSRHVATEVARAVLACLRDLTPTEPSRPVLAGLPSPRWGHWGTSSQWVRARTQRVTAAIDCTPYAKATPDAYADAALDAVRDALTSDDPQVVRAMAERVGLHEERATAPVWEQCDRQDCSEWGAGISALWAAQRGVLVVPGDEPTKPHTHGAARWVIKARLTTPWREVPDA